MGQPNWQGSAWNLYLRILSGVKDAFFAVFCQVQRSADQFLLPEVWREGFLTFCTSHWLGRGHQHPSRHPKSPRSGGCRQQGLFLSRDSYMLFLRGQKWTKMDQKSGFLDLTRPLDRVMRSNLVQNWQATSLVHVKVMIHVCRPYFTIKLLPGCPENQDFEPKWTKKAVFWT